MLYQPHRQIARYEGLVPNYSHPAMLRCAMFAVPNGGNWVDWCNADRTFTRETNTDVMESDDTGMGQGTRITDCEIDLSVTTFFPLRQNGGVEQYTVIASFMPLITPTSTERYILRDFTGGGTCCTIKAASNGWTAQSLSITTVSATGTVTGGTPYVICYTVDGYASGEGSFFVVNGETIGSAAGSANHTFKDFVMADIFSDPFQSSGDIVGGFMLISNTYIGEDLARDVTVNPGQLFAPAHWGISGWPAAAVAGGATIMNQFQGPNVGADLFNGTLQ